MRLTKPRILAGRTSEHSGAYLMQHGLDLPLRGDYGSTLVILTRQ